jgi:hypothetical protein
MLNESYQVHDLAEKLSQALTTDKRNDGSEFVHLKDNAPAWMTEVIRSVHGEKLPDDTTYAFISKCADAISEGDDANDAITEIEPDIYTQDLTAWLHSRADHVYYLTEVLEESEVKDGFQLLAAAQQKQIQEIGFALISALENVEVQS